MAAGSCPRCRQRLYHRQGRSGGAAKVEGVFDWFKRRGQPASTPESVAPDGKSWGAPPTLFLPPAAKPQPGEAREGKRPSSPRLPERIGRYRVVGLLGQGGMARVYLVEFDNEDDQEPHRYALKTLIPLDDGDGEAYERFMREIQICIKLRHPNVCRMVDWNIEQDKTAYIVMELLEGEVLVEYVTRMAPMSVGLARPLIVQMLKGLEAIHAVDVVHRDLKPGNVFVTNDGTLKIMDFGIARKAGLKSLTATGSALGTPEFISPEQVLDTHNVDHRTDLFNVGLIFYEMLTTRLPFEADTVSDMLLRLVRGTLTPLSAWRSDLPPDLEAWTMKILAQDRERRFQTAREALDAITW